MKVLGKSWQFGRGQLEPFLTETMLFEDMNPKPETLDSAYSTVTRLHLHRERYSPP